MSAPQRLALVTGGHARVGEVISRTLAARGWTVLVHARQGAARAEALAREHGAMPHGGFVIRSGNTSQANKQVIEYRLQLDSNPEFTSSVLVAYARAVHRMAQAGQFGCKTVFDVAPGLLSPQSPAELRERLL